MTGWRPYVKTVWTDERIALLVKLWTEGKSSRECAAAIDPTGVLTRSAVCGKVFRLGLPTRPKQDRAIQITRTVRAKPIAHPVPRRDAAPKLKPAKPTPQAKAPPVLIDVTTFRTVTILTMTSADCRFDMGGEGADALFCGEPRAGRFCKHHDKIGSQVALSPTKPPREARVASVRPGRLSAVDLKWGKSW